MGLLDMLGAGLDDPRNIAALRMGGLISQGAVGQTRPQSLFGLLGQGAGAYSDTMRQARADEMERSKFDMLQDRAQREKDDYQRQLEQAAAQQRQMSEIGMRALSLAGDDPAKRALALADPLEFIKSAQPAPKEIDRVIRTPEGQLGIAKDGSVVQAWPLEADLQNVNGVWVDRNRATSGSVAPQDVTALVTRGEDGQPALNPLAFQARRQIAAAGAPQVNVGPTTPGSEAVDKKFATDFVEFATGGFADVMKQLGQLQEARDALASGRDTISGFVVGNLPEGVAAAVAPESVSVREAIQEVAQRNLRLVLGAQFTEKEGERLINRVYNPRLGEQENLKRLERLMEQIRQAAEAKMDASRYFMANRTLEGWGGRLPRLQDFDPDFSPKGPTVSGKITQPGEQPSGWKIERVR